MLKFIKKQWQNLLLLFFVVLLIIPQTRFPLQVALQRFIAFAPSTLSAEETQFVNLENWILTSASGEVIAPKHSDKPIVINFWATWCPPCVAEMPSFQKLYEDYENKVTFLFISGEDFETMEKFSKQYNLTLPLFKSQNTIPQELDGQALPTTYVLDNQRKLIVKHVGSADWNSTKFRETLETLLSE